MNYSKIARDVGTSSNTVQSYYEILEDTLIGFRLAPFHRFIRKRQSGAAKFYLFDTGVQRSLSRSLTVPLLPSTYAYGVAFEHFIINEIVKLQQYLNTDFECSYLRTKDGAEIDLVIDSAEKRHRANPGLDFVTFISRGTRGPRPILKTGSLEESVDRYSALLAWFVPTRFSVAVE